MINTVAPPTAFEHKPFSILVFDRAAMRWHECEVRGSMDAAVQRADQLLNDLVAAGKLGICLPFAAAVLNRDTWEVWTRCNEWLGPDKTSALDRAIDVMCITPNASATINQRNAAIGVTA